MNDTVTEVQLSTCFETTGFFFFGINFVNGSINFGYYVGGTTRF